MIVFYVSCCYARYDLGVLSGAAKPSKNTQFAIKTTIVIILLGIFKARKLL